VPILFALRNPKDESVARLRRIQRIVRRLVKAGRWLRVPYGVERSLLREISEDEVRNALLTGRVVTYDQGRDRFVIADRIRGRGEIRVVAEFGYDAAGDPIAVQVITGYFPDE